MITKAPYNQNKAEQKNQDFVNNLGDRINGYSRKTGETPLFKAVYTKNLDLTQKLLNAGADPNQTTRDGRSSLMWAIGDKNEKMVKELVEHDAKIDTPSAQHAIKMSMTPPYGKPNPEIIATLINALSDQNKDNPDQNHVTTQLIENGLCNAQMLRGKNPTIQQKTPENLKNCLKQLTKSSQPSTSDALNVLLEANEGNKNATRMIQRAQKMVNKKIAKIPSSSPQPTEILALQGKSQEAALGG